METLVGTAEGNVNRNPAFRRVAVGVDGYPEGTDAIALGSALDHLAGTDVMLVAVHPPSVAVLPSELGWRAVEQQARSALAKARDSLAPGARIDVETDVSVPRALQRVVRRENRDLLIVGSSRHAPDGHVRIGKRTRQLLCHFESPLAVAPRGLHQRPALRFERIGVGYDGDPEAKAALAVAASLAHASGAQLHVRAVVDDRMPFLAYAPPSPAVAATPAWKKGIESQMTSLQADAQALARASGADAHIEVTRGRPADSLLSLSHDVDLLVIGSRRWGPASRLLLGSTGEALMHDASCPVVAVPRPRA